MYTVLTWVVLAVYPILFARRDSYTYPVDNKVEDYWHWIGWFLRATFAYYACPSEFLVSYAFYFWIVFDGLYNLWTNKPWGFIGTTAGFDKALRMIGGNWVKFVGLSGSVGYLIFKELI